VFQNQKEELRETLRRKLQTFHSRDQSRGYENAIRKRSSLVMSGNDDESNMDPIAAMQRH
jgi:hypothetical protein